MNCRIFLMIAGASSIAFLAACQPMTPAKPDIVDIAAGNPDFSTLVTAVSAAGLLDTLKGPGPFTVFAPTNEAFAGELPPVTLDMLLKPENKAKLVSILTYHVVPGAVMSASLAGKVLDVATVEGQTVHIDGRKGVKVNNANVVTADITASNGVIHVIDTVLLPKESQLGRPVARRGRPGSPANCGGCDARNRRDFIWAGSLGYRPSACRSWLRPVPEWAMSLETIAADPEPVDAVRDLQGGRAGGCSERLRPVYPVRAVERGLCPVAGGNAGQSAEAGEQCPVGRSAALSPCPARYHRRGVEPADPALSRRFNAATFRSTAWLACG